MGNSMSERRGDVVRRVRLIDLLVMSKRRMVPGNGLGAAALLAKVCIVEGMVLLMAGAICLLKSPDWVQISPPTAVPRLPAGFVNPTPYTGDLYSKDGLPAADRKVVIDAIMQAGMDPRAREMLDEALREEGKILQQLVKTRTISTVLGPLKRRENGGNPIYMIQLLGYHFCYFRDASAFDVLIVDPGLSERQYTNADPPASMLRNLSALFNEIDQSRPALLSQMQIDTLIKPVVQTHLHAQPGQLPAELKIDAFKFCPDGSLKVHQDGGWTWIDLSGLSSGYSPEDTAAINWLSYKNSKLDGTIPVSRWAAALLELAAIVILFTGIAAYIRALSRMGNGTLWTGLFVSGTLLAMFSVTWVAWGLISHSAIEFSSVGTIVRFGGVAILGILWMTAMGIVGPIRVAAINDSPICPP
jgi:hypothetical protein